MIEAKRFCVKMIIFVSSLLVVQLSSALSSENSGQLREQLRRRLEATRVSPPLQVGDEAIHASTVLPIFYERRAYEPAWVDSQGPLPIVERLVATLSLAGRHGLRADDYHLNRIVKLSKLRGRRPDLGSLVDLELVCTDAFLIYGSHLLSGRVNPQTIDAEWFANRREADLAAVLEKAIELNSVDSVLGTLVPPQPGYKSLTLALRRYKDVARKGGWELIAEGPSMKKGDAGSRVASLRRRLVATGDQEAIPIEADSVFDEGLRLAVTRFQNRHGLEADGVVGPATLAALNIPVEQRVSQISLNLERWRWLPQDLGRRHILVNIANFELDVFAGRSMVMSMRVIVGKTYRRTPVFSDRITYIVLNPYWNVPPSLAAKDVLPAVKKNPAHLAENDFEVLVGWGAEMQTVDPATVDWTNVNGKNMRYRFRQKPGLKNALGRIKIMFPNQFDVYLHDTPARGLFAKTKRDFSSGCIRIERPMDLAVYLLSDSARWSAESLETAISRGTEQTIRLPEAIPVHILYWTAWAGPDGTVHFRDDIYERDKPLAEALLEEPPAAH